MTVKIRLLNANGGVNSECDDVPEGGCCLADEGEISEGAEFSQVKFKPGPMQLVVFDSRRCTMKSPDKVEEAAALYQTVVRRQGVQSAGWYSGARLQSDDHFSGLREGCENGFIRARKVSGGNSTLN